MIQNRLHKRFVELSTPLDCIPTDTVPLIQVLGNIKLIAYDFYGTLFISGVGDIGIDDGNPDSGSLSGAFAGCGIHILQKSVASEGFIIYNRIVSEHINRLKEKGISYPEPDIREVWKQVLNEMSEQKLISYEPDGAIYDLMSVEFEARMNPVWPMPGAIETLLAFRQAGITQGIISNSQFYTPIALEALTGLSLKELGFADTLLHWSFEENMKKPGVDFYKRYLKKVAGFDPSISPDQILYIGNDMLKDIWPAHTLGMKTALFAGDKRSLKWRKEDERCKDLKPDLVVTSLDQIRSAVIL